PGHVRDFWNDWEDVLVYDLEAIDAGPLCTDAQAAASACPAGSQLGEISVDIEGFGTATGKFFATNSPGHKTVGEITLRQGVVARFTGEIGGANRSTLSFTGLPQLPFTAIRVKTTTAAAWITNTCAIRTSRTSARGEGHRNVFIGREKGYHGVGFGGVSVGGLVNNRRAFVLLPGVDHIRHTHDPARNAFARGQPAHGAERAEDLEQLIALHGAETIAAVIVEPVAGSAGVLPPPVGYLERLRAICDAHGILLIFDEVITGFGRLGAPFATQFFGVTPDLMTTAKGITNGVLPMGAVFASRAVHDALMTGPETAIEFFHGYTYSGHPVACAAGLAALEIYQRDGLFTRAATLSSTWEKAVHALREAPHVIDVRNIGLMAAIDLAPRPEAPGARGYDTLVKGLEAGVLVRATGDTIALSPPLIANTDDIERLLSTLREVLVGIR
ncbi:MAG: aminotransferase class III-fold pyridoxal phosphate-dependent enzyme, partial [Phenylobacterium sp.]